MLNAFRHRRSVRIKWVDLDESLIECSTPFGIGDRCGSQIDTFNNLKEVLNAFRHRRSVRALHAVSTDASV
ncbi:uncharacterized protein Dmul_04140 [Desulfococcus multivorans]|nr:uncharacterized protein Dmul_04140 [Desulfococcus multivorans]